MIKDSPGKHVGVGSINHLLAIYSEVEGHQRVWPDGQKIVQRFMLSFYLVKLRFYQTVGCLLVASWLRAQPELHKNATDSPGFWWPMHMISHMVHTSLVRLDVSIKMFNKICVRDMSVYIYIYMCRTIYSNVYICIYIVFVWYMLCIYIYVCVQELRSDVYICILIVLYD